MAEAVVDALEIIQIEADHRYRTIGRRLDLSERFFQQAREEHAIWQSGERVVHRLMDERLFEALASGDIDHRGARPAYAAIDVEFATALDQAVDSLTGPRDELAFDFRDLAVECPLVGREQIETCIALKQKNERLPDHFVALEPERRQEELVAIDNARFAGSLLRDHVHDRGFFEQAPVS